MTYQADCDRHNAESKEAYRLWEVWQDSKKEEDKDKWWAALTNLPKKSYLTIQLKIWPGDEVEADKIKEMLENNGTNLPWLNQNLYHGDKIIAEIIEARASVWPKPAM